MATELALSMWVQPSHLSAGQVPQTDMVLSSPGAAPKPSLPMAGGWLLLHPPPAPLPASSTQGAADSTLDSRRGWQGLCPPPPATVPAECPHPCSQGPTLPVAFRPRWRVEPWHTTTHIVPSTCPAVVREPPDVTSCFLLGLGEAGQTRWP